MPKCSKSEIVFKNVIGFVHIYLYFKMINGKDCMEWAARNPTKTNKKDRNTMNELDPFDPLYIVYYYYYYYYYNNNNKKTRFVNTSKQVK
jgi:hypothetical protein